MVADVLLAAGDTPVLLSGGISTGQDIKSAIDQGAAGELFEALLDLRRQWRTTGNAELQAGEIACFCPFFSLGHQCANGSGGGVELIYFVFFTHFPETVGFRIGGNAFEHNRCGPVL